MINIHLNNILNIVFLVTLEGINNETLESMKYLLSTFENIHADYHEITKPRGCIFKHIKEIELQTKCVNICFHCCITYVVKTNILELIYK